MQKGELLTLQLVIDPKHAEIKTEPTEGNSDAPPSFTAAIDIPANLMPHVPRSVLWDTVWGNFGALLRSVLTQETVFHFGDVVNATLLDHDPTLGSKRQIIEEHVERTTERLKRAFQITMKGQPSAWSALELAIAVKGVMEGLAGSRRTYDVVAERMQKIYGAKAPTSGEGLRKLVKRFEIDWKALKNGH